MKVFVLFLVFFLLADASQASTQKSTQDEVKIAGKTLAVVTNGDFVHPALSSDGSKLAYSRVVVEKKMELAEIAILDLKTGKTKVLLTPAASKKYAAYSAFVSELRWLDNNRLFAIVPDGDVDYAELTFNVRLGKLIKSSLSGGAEDFTSPPETKKAIGQIRLIAPNMPEDVLSTAWDVNTYLEIPLRGYFIQTNYYRYDNSIRFYDFQNKKEKMVMEIPDSDQPFPKLSGGFTFGDKVIFALTGDKEVRVMEFDGEITRALLEKKLKSDAYFSLQVKQHTPDKGIFLLAPDSTRSEEKSELWVYDKSGLKRSADVSDLLDVDIRAGKAAFCYWVGGKRNIEVKELLTQ